MAGMEQTVPTSLSADRRTEPAQKDNKALDVDLMKRLAVDATAAMAATLAVSPIMTVIDRGVVEAAAGGTTLLASMRASLVTIAKRPHRFIATRPFAVMMLLYSGTYLTANVTDTLISAREGLPADSTTTSATKFCTVTGVNMGLSLYKDASFARTFGAGLKRSMPAISYAPLVLRDGITLFATFNLPALVAPLLPEGVDGFAHRLSAAQLVLPAASQFLATPLHVLGLDLYYRGGTVTWADRFQVIKRTWLGTSFARACRVIPAYGVGGVINNDARAYLMGHLD